MPPQGGNAAAAGAAGDKAPATAKGLGALLGHGGAEGEDCNVPACRTMVDVLKRATGMAAKQQKGQQQQGDSGKGSMAAAGAEGDEGVEVVGSAAWRKQHCPLGKEALGDATWGFLHSTAAYYPERPTPEEQGLARSLIQSVAAFYPCGYCRKDFAASVQTDPPKVESRAAFAGWLCRQHNLVNEKLGKPLFDCGMANLDKRWRTGEDKCWEEDVPIEHNDSSTTGSTAAAAQAPRAGKEEKPKIYIIEPKEKK